MTCGPTGILRLAGLWRGGTLRQFGSWQQSSDPIPTEIWVYGFEGDSDNLRTWWQENSSFQINSSGQVRFQEQDCPCLSVYLGRYVCNVDDIAGVTSLCLSDESSLLLGQCINATSTAQDDTTNGPLAWQGAKLDTDSRPWGTLAPENRSRMVR